MNWTTKNNCIEKTFTFPNQTELARFLLEVAEIADKENHHPDAEIYQCSKLKLRLTTHDQQQITALDYKLAQLIDVLADKHGL